VGEVRVGEEFGGGRGDHRLGDVGEPEVGGADAEQAGGEQRFPAGAFSGKEPADEGGQEERAEGEEGEQQPTVVTAWSAVMTAVAALGVHMHGRRDDAEAVRRSLGRVEPYLIQLLQAVHNVRVTIGDAEPDEDKG
jgi:hypothetical protein